MASRARQTLPLVLMIVLLAGLPARPATAWTVAAGVNHSDVGLFKDRGGEVLGVSHTLVFPGSPWRVTLGLDYVARRGEQPRYYSDSEAPLFHADAEVTLRYLQPTALLGRHIPVGPLALRPYAGFSQTMKLEESWEQPDAETVGSFEYENSGTMAHLGMALERGSILVDVRYSVGLREQLVAISGVSGTPGAHDELHTTDFEDGAAFSAVQACLGWRF